MTHTEVEELSRCNFFTPIMQTEGMKGGRVYLPYAFTEQGIYMPMTVLKGDLAVKQSKALIRLFKKMKHYFEVEADIKIDTLFTLIDKYKIEDKQGIFIQGQIFDAYIAFQGLIQKARKEIILIDNYIDLSVLERLSHQ